MNHNIDLNFINARTDLAIDELKDSNQNNYTDYREDGDIKITSVNIDDKNKEKFNKKNGKYITIEFSDITDYNNEKEVERVFIEELQNILKTHNISDDASCLVIGLGNDKSTPDALGPISINDIIVTNHFYNLGIDVEDGFRPVSAFNPGVMGQTGIETSDIIYALVNKIKPDFVIVIDALKASNVNRVNKTIQITDAGINPGSGIGNTRKEISKNVIGVPVFAVGVPTVVDTITIVTDVFNYMDNYFSYMKSNIDNPKEKLKIVRTNISKENLSTEDKQNLFGLIGTLSNDEFRNLISEIINGAGYNMIVTPKEVDFIIKKLSNVISSGINNTLHKNVNHL